MLWITEYDETKDRELFRQDCLEEGRAEGLAEGKAEGRAEGEAIGEDKLGTLISKLLSEDRLEEAKKASTDSSFRQKLYKEFNL